MNAFLKDVTLARVPAAALHFLADVRCLPGVMAAIDGDHAWLRWEAGETEVLYRVLPIPGAALYVHREGRWYRAAKRLPAWDVPAQLDYRPLSHILFPAPLTPVPPPDLPVRPVPLTLVPDSRPRATTAVCCDVRDLAAWADRIPTARLGKIHAALRRQQALLFGERLPLFEAGERFWGKRVLVPLGKGLEPALPESAVVSALHLGEQQIVLCHNDSMEIVPEDALQPLCRARIRLAVETRRVNEGHR